MQLLSSCLVFFSGARRRAPGGGEVPDLGGTIQTSSIHKKTELRYVHGPMTQKYLANTYRYLGGDLPPLSFINQSYDLVICLTSFLAKTRAHHPSTHVLMIHHVTYHLASLGNP